MKLLIVFNSRCGYTRHLMQRLAKALPEATLCDLSHGRPLDPRDYDRVIIGGPVYAGRLGFALRRYLKKHEPTLAQKELGIFIACLLLDRAVEQMKSGFPKSLFEKAQCRAFVGGEANSPLGRVMLRTLENQPLVTSEMAQAAWEQLISFGGKV